MEYSVADIRRMPQDLEALCGAEAKARQVEKYLLPEAKARTLLGIYTAKQLLARMLGRPARQLKIEYTPLGKPYLPNSRVQVSISHSGPWVLCAAHEGAVGADIEVLKQPDFRLCQKIATPGEQAYIGHDARRFLEVWTAKEAYLKLTGEGLLGGMKTVETADPSGLRTQIQNCRLQRFLHEDAVCAIVYEET